MELIDVLWGALLAIGGYLLNASERRAAKLEARIEAIDSRFLSHEVAQAREMLTSAEFDVAMAKLEARIDAKFAALESGMQTRMQTIVDWIGAQNGVPRVNRP